MSRDASVTNSVPPAPGATTAEACQWIKCRGCGGEVGIPAGWPENEVECPECGLTVQIKGKVLYRPPSAPPAPLTAPVLAPRGPSLELIRKADMPMICGILSVVLGWTFIVPIFGICGYSDTFSMAKKEQVPVPGKATVGLVLCLLFGAAQGLAVISRFAK